MNVCVRWVLAGVVACLLNMQAIGFTKFPICTAEGSQANPRISGNHVVWEDKRGTTDDIYGYNLITGEEFPIAAGAVHERHVAIDNDIVVWTEATGVADQDIYGKNLITGEVFAVSTAAGDQSRAVIGGDLVVWHDDRGTPSGLYGKYLSGGDEFLISDGPTQDHATDGDLVVWATHLDAGVNAIYGKYLSTNEEIVIIEQTGNQDQPALSDDIVVWHNVNDVYGKNLNTDEIFPISTHPAQQYVPEISGNYVVWADDRNGYDDVYGYDLTTGHEFPICVSEISSWMADIDGNLVVWAEGEGGGGNYNIYGAYIPEPCTLALLALGGLAVQSNRKGRKLGRCG